MRTLLFQTAGSLAALAVAFGSCRSTEALEPLLRTGDRVALLGDATIERAAAHSYLETALTARFPDLHLRFRNIGWSGDDVRGRARCGFDPPSAGPGKLAEHIRLAEPTVVVIAYGSVDSFDGDRGLDRFRAGLEAVLESVRAAGARPIFLTPMRAEDVGRPLPDPRPHNEDLAKYVEVIRAVARDANAPIVDIFRDLVPEPSGGERLTTNGIHLTPSGYRRWAEAVAAGLGAPVPRWFVAIDARSARVEDDGTTVSELEAIADRVAFVAEDETLPPSPPPAEPGSPAPAFRVDRTLRVRGLAPGDWMLAVDGKEVAQADAARWAEGVTLTAGAEFEQIEELRAHIERKSFLWFCRWRPQNDTYLFLFRKHEQGDLAQEIPDFDPLIAEEEARIASLAAPRARRYLLEPVRSADGSTASSSPKTER